MIFKHMCLALPADKVGYVLSLGSGHSQCGGPEVNLIIMVINYLYIWQ